MLAQVQNEEKALLQQEIVPSSPAVNFDKRLYMDPLRIMMDSHPQIARECSMFCDDVDGMR